MQPVAIAFPFRCLLCPKYLNTFNEAVKDCTGYMRLHPQGADTVFAVFAWLHSKGIQFVAFCGEAEIRTRKIFLDGI